MSTVGGGASGTRAPARVGGVAELRIHGVGGSPGPRLLGYEDLDETEIVDREPIDDGGSIVVRRRKDDRRGLVEGFDWGYLNSGRPLQALWVFLLPFSLVNAAGWMLGSDDGTSPKYRQLDRVAAGVVVVLGLALTATWTAWILDLLVGYMGYQLLPSALGSPTIVRLAGGGSFTYTPDLRHHQVVGVAVGLVAAALGLLALTAVVIRSHRKGQRVADLAAGDAQGGRPNLDASLATAMTSTRLSVRRRNRLHLAVTGAVIGVVAFQSVLALRRDERPAVLPIDTTVVALSGMQLVLLFVLWAITRIRTGPRTGPAAAAAALAFVLSTALLAGGSLWSIQHLPGIVRAPVCHASSPSVDDGVALCARRNVATALPDADATPASVEKGSPELVPGRSLAYVDGLMLSLLAWVVVLLVVARRVWFGSRSKTFRIAVDGVPTARVEAVQRAGRTAVIVHRVDRLAGWLSAAAWAALLASALTHVDADGDGFAVWRWTIGPALVDSAPFRLAAWLLPGFAVLVALRVRKGVSDNRVRRFLGQAWDVLSFFPRCYHPFAVRPYCHEVVPRFQAEITALTEQDAMAVLVSAHSQGTAIAFTSLDCLTDDELGTIGLVTYGSHLGTLYRCCFPYWFGRSRAEALRRRLRQRWINLYRRTDPIGGAVFAAGDPADILLDDPARLAASPRDGDPPLERDREPGTSIAGHSGYLAERVLKDRVDELKRELSAPAPREGRP